MSDKHLHILEVQSFLRSNIAQEAWQVEFPAGSGHETYYASSVAGRFFIKLGAHTDRYQILAGLGLAAPVRMQGSLSDGTPILVQERIDGRNPSREDYRKYLAKFANVIRKMHQCRALINILPRIEPDTFAQAGLLMLDSILKRWEGIKKQVPAHITFVDNAIAQLETQVCNFNGAGLIASHNDICKGNWLVTPEGRLYLLYLDSMSRDDPALDIGLRCGGTTRLNFVRNFYR